MRCVNILDLKYNHEIVPLLIQTQIAYYSLLPPSCWNLVDDYKAPLCVQDTRHSLTLMALKQSDAGGGLRVVGTYQGLSVGCGYERSGCGTYEGLSRVVIAIVMAGQHSPVGVVVAV